MSTSSGLTTGDSVVQDVVRKYNSRSLVGIEKYGITLERDDLTIEQWLTHLQEELMDATLYVEKLLREMVKLRNSINTQNNLED